MSPEELCDIDLPLQNKKYRVLTSHLSPLQVCQEPPEGWEEVFANSYEQIQFDEEKIKQLKEPIMPPLPSIFHMYQRMSPSSIRVMIVIDEPDNSDLGFNNMCGYGFSSKTIGTEPITYLTKRIHDRLFETVENMSLPPNNNFSKWFTQGIFLTSLCLTTSKSFSHKPMWSGFTIQAIKYLAKTYPKIIFLFWGKEASMLSNYTGKATYFKTGSIYAKQGKDCFHEMNHS